MEYSVLMSVYKKERPEYLKRSIQSMFSQTALTNDFVLVCDGPLTPELDAVIQAEAGEHPDTMRVVRLEKNIGLGAALNAGLAYCKNQLVARMDSDDISLPCRCARQLAVMTEDPGISIVGAVVSEFEQDENVETGQRTVPAEYEDIVRFSKKRNPFNHPSVMFRKAAVESAGGYSQQYPLFEDYYLWVRMLKNGARAYNIQDVLLKMRILPGTFLRRGGRVYATDLLRFHSWMYKTSWTSLADLCTGAVPHALICLMPNRVRMRLYGRLRAASRRSNNNYGG